jgi:hypothetical protein
MKFRTHAQCHLSKITAENDDWQQKENVNTGCVSTILTLNAGMTNTNFTVSSATVKNVCILCDADNLPQRQSPHRSLMCAGAVHTHGVLLRLDPAVKTHQYQTWQLINGANELLPTDSTIHKTVWALSLTLNYLIHMDNFTKSKYSNYNSLGGGML